MHTLTIEPAKPDPQFVSFYTARLDRFKAMHKEFIKLGVPENDERYILIRRAINSAYQMVPHHA